MASFTATPRTGCLPMAVNFTNTSTGSTSYFWDLGNGNTSTTANPANVYTLPGFYTIKLIAYDNFGQSDTIVVSNYIQVYAFPIADFTAAPLQACMEQNSISFNNNSSGATTYFWDFGDGQTSTLSNPTHTYQNAGQFNVTLIATGPGGCFDTKVRQQYITINPKPTGFISVNGGSPCNLGAPFNFILNASNVASCTWHFGDGTTSSALTPSHIFPATGTYNVMCIVNNTFGCSDTFFLPQPIVINQSGWGYFTSNADTGCSPFTVSFDIPFNGTYFWDFGDGNTSSLQSPVNTYLGSGVYNVSCIITLPTGCTDTIRYNNFIHVGEKPFVDFLLSDTIGCAPLPIQFSNLGSGYTQVHWNFGDGTTSSQINPLKTYNVAGDFTVTLTLLDQYGCRSAKAINEAVNVHDVRALFNATPRVGCPPMNVNFSNNSYGQSLSYTWIYGDGTNGLGLSPSHVYNNIGIYDVTLIATDSIGCSDTLIKPAYIVLNNNSSGYTPPPTVHGCAPYLAQFGDNTLGAISWLWDFGDGNTSNLQHPLHTYAYPGYYIVSLTTTTNGGGCINTIDTFATYHIHGVSANFNFTQNQCPPFTAWFTDSSTNAVSWLWNFGNGQTSSLQNPTHIFTSGGYHSVTLTVTDAFGCSAITSQSNGIYYPPFGASFYGVPLDTVFPVDVQFYANSVGATSWFWNFGDGGNSNSEDPLHTYLSPGPYNVTLTIANPQCTLTVTPPSGYNFQPPDTTPIGNGGSLIPPQITGCAPLNITFSLANSISNAVAWHWDFGNGDSSNSRYPNYTFYNPGLYHITLTTWSAAGVSTVHYYDSLVLVNGPIPSFSYTQTAACSNTIVQFQNSTIGANSYHWNFGDGDTSNIFNPIHTYGSAQSNYLITLTASDTNGCSASISSGIFTTAIAATLASETEICGYDSISFSSSLVGYQNYTWDFGDGNSSNLSNPTHLYANEGIYQVTLTITDVSGCTQTFPMPTPITVYYPVANFYATGTTRACNRLRVDYLNTSTNADAYFWEFGDGGASTAINPFNTYFNAGEYDVTLTVYRGVCFNSITLVDYIKVDSAIANFNFVTNSLCNPVTVTFTDSSITPLSWHWDFGNGDTSNIQNPVYTYSSPPLNPISLSIVDINGCRDTLRLQGFNVLEAAMDTASFSGCVPYTISFTDNSSLAQLWLWDFGDGTTSTAQHPNHTYTQRGDYTVTLIVSADTVLGSCTDTIMQVSKIIVRDPLAAFSANTQVSCAPMIVNFNNQSVDAVSYFWDFGDSTYSTVENPVKVYNYPGWYTVSLVVVSDNGCTDTLTMFQFIRVQGPVPHFNASTTTGCAPVSVHFQNYTFGAVSYQWNFGDGFTATTQHTNHTYQDTGTYTVTLIATDAAGCVGFYQLPQPLVVRPTPIAGFLYSDSAGCQPYPVQFTNLSIGFDTLYWNFGDGGISNFVQPTHHYLTAGIFTPFIVAINQYGCRDTSFSSTSIKVFNTPEANFTLSNAQVCPPTVVQFLDSSIADSGSVYTWITSFDTLHTIAASMTFSNPGIYDVTLQIISPNGCADTLSLINALLVRDTIAPNQTNIYNVTVLNNNAIEINWEPNTAVDLGAYYLWRHDDVNLTWQLVFNDTNPSNSGFGIVPTFIDTLVSTLDRVYYYTLQAGDVCNFRLPIDANAAHNTMNIATARQGQAIAVSWNEYGGCNISSYDIYRKPESQTNWDYLSTITPGTGNYLDSTITCPIYYSYKIVARDICGNIYTSDSDTAQWRIEDLLDGQVAFTVRSTVVNDEFILTEWMEPTVRPASIVQYDVYKSGDNTVFKYFTTVPASQTYLVDYDVDTHHQQYFYKILARNNCDVQQDLSTETSSVVLDGLMDQDRMVHLKWKPYQGWNDGVDYYLIERLDEFGNWQIIKKIEGDKSNISFPEQ